VQGAGAGVYRVDRYGAVELLPGSEQIVFPNGLAFDHRGNLYVTESLSGSAGDYGQGGIWRIPPGERRRSGCVTRRAPGLEGELGDAQNGTARRSPGLRYQWRPRRASCRGRSCTIAAATGSSLTTVSCV